MAVFTPGQTIETTVGVVAVDAGLDVGVHHFQLVVIDENNHASDAVVAAVVVRKRPGPGPGPGPGPISDPIPHPLPGPIPGPLLHPLPGPLPPDAGGAPRVAGDAPPDAGAAPGQVSGGSTATMRAPLPGDEQARAAAGAPRRQRRKKASATKDE